MSESSALFISDNGLLSTNQIKNVPLKNFQTINITGDAVPGNADLVGISSTIANNTTSYASNLVAGAFHAHNLGSMPGKIVFGFAAESWSGLAGTVPSGSAALVAIDAGVISQFSNNTDALYGLNAVFKDRPDSFSQPTSGLGSNKYNDNSVALQCDSQFRGVPSNEYCGWNTILRVGNIAADAGIDWSTSKQYATIIDMTAPSFAATQVANVKQNNWFWVELYLVGATYYGKMYRQVGSNSRLEYWKTTNPSIAFTVASGTLMYYVDLTSNVVGTNTLQIGNMFSIINASAASATAGASGAVPAQVAGYFIFQYNGTTAKVPYYNN